MLKLVMASDMAQRWNIDRRVINNWTKRDPSFPKPTMLVGCGKYPLYVESEMIEYGKLKGLEMDWKLIHNKFGCMICRTSWETHVMKVYDGTTRKGEHLRKYECTNPECNHVEVITLEEKEKNE